MAGWPLLCWDLWPLHSSSSSLGLLHVTRHVGGLSVLQSACLACLLGTTCACRSLNVALVPDVAAALAAAGGGRTGLPNSVASAAKLRSMQSTNHVLMVAPTAFGFNEQAAQDNSFMHAATKPGEGSDLTRQVRRVVLCVHMSWHMGGARGDGGLLIRHGREDTPISCSQTACLSCRRAPLRCVLLLLHAVLCCAVGAGVR